MQNKNKPVAENEAKGSETIDLVDHWGLNFLILVISRLDGGTLITLCINQITGSNSLLEWIVIGHQIPCHGQWNGHSGFGNTQPENQQQNSKLDSVQSLKRIVQSTLYVHSPIYIVKYFQYRSTLYIATTRSHSFEHNFKRKWSLKVKTITTCFWYILPAARRNNDVWPQWKKGAAGKELMCSFSDVTEIMTVPITVQFAVCQ